jgi:glutathione S-transferase
VFVLHVHLQMPILLLPDGSSLPESEVITQYLLDKSGGGMQAATPELRAVAALAARIHDQYITPIQVILILRRFFSMPACMLCTAVLTKGLRA